MKRMKKLFMSLGLGAMLLLGSVSAVSAAVKGELEAFQEPEVVTTPVLEVHDADVPAAYIGEPADDGGRQTAATLDSVSLAWDPVEDATDYRVYLGTFNAQTGFKDLKTTKGSTKCTIKGLKAGTVYTVRILALNASEHSDYYLRIHVSTLHNGADIKKITTNRDGNYLFNMKVPVWTKAITGYRVSYKNLKTGASFTRYYEGHAFSVTPKPNMFYQLLIRPYLELNGKKYVGPGTTQYIAQQPRLYKRGTTSSSLSISWNKVYGATTYTVYVKYPGTTSYVKVKRTAGLRYTLTGMKQNKDYFIKVVANRGSARSASSTYYRMRLTR